MQSFNPAVSHKRKERDITKLLMDNYKVITKDRFAFEFSVEIQGPLDSLYTGGTWNLKIILPDQYPYKSPCIGFENKIYHPNIDQASGTVCLDVLNQSWSPMFDLINVLEMFIPQLLQYPNPNHPLNVEAASLMLRDKEKYELKVKEMVLKHAIKTVLIEKKESLDININQLTTKDEGMCSIDTRSIVEKMAIEVNEEIMSQISLSDVSDLSIIEENNEIMWQY